ncbi:MAG: HYR domain-containing protein, partial [Bacteroidota bacterium]
APGSTFSLGSTTNTFIVTDASGNEATCSFTITIQPETDPDAATFDCLSGDIRLTPNASCEYIVGDYINSVTNFQNFTSQSVVQNIAPGTRILEDTYIILDVLDDGVIVGTCEFWLNIDANDVPEIIQCAPGITRTLTDGEFVLGDYTSEVEISSSCEGTTLQQIPAPGTIITSTTQVEIKLLDTNNIEIDACSFTITIQPKTVPIPANPFEYIFIYPNPTPGPFKFEVPNGWIIEKVDVFDYRGRYITTVEFPMGGPYNMDLSTLQTAVYTLHLATNQGNKIIRVIIQ